MRVEYHISEAKVKDRYYKLRLALIRKPLNHLHQVFPDLYQRRLCDVLLFALVTACIIYSLTRMPIALPRTLKLIPNRHRVDL